MMQVMDVETSANRIPSLERILSLRPNSTIAGDLAGCYFTVGESEKALPLALAAWDKNKHPSMGMNLALILKDLGRHDESFKVVQEAYWINPNDDYIRLGYSEALLRKGFWRQAWPLYEHARPTQLGAALELELPSECKEWNGESLSEDHLLLVINEGGAGDRWNYARWLPELTKKGINWRFYPYSVFFNFFERVLPRQQLMIDGEKLKNPPTHWATTFSLPAKLDAVPTQIPPAIPFTAKPEIAERYKFQTFDGLPVVGLCFEAAEKFQGGRRVRSMTEGQAMRLATMTADRVHWISLQHGKKMPYPVQYVPFETWEDTAGLLSALDAIVTVDTGTFWLASAMGKEVYLLLPGNGDWKYGETPKCYWSPTVKYYRNDGLGFENAITSLISDIRQGKILTPKSTL